MSALDACKSKYKYCRLCELDNARKRIENRGITESLSTESTVITRGKIILTRTAVETDASKTWEKVILRVV